MQKIFDKSLVYTPDTGASGLIEATDDILSDAVSMRMIADVPLGVFLSGGIDSSLVTALMQKGSMNAVKTFSIGFNHGRFDEAHHAKGIATHLGTDHTEFYVSHDDAREIIPLIPQIYDEPFSDSSQIPTYLVSKLTRQHVTVALSGDGGDEVFGGYSRYLVASQYGKFLFGLSKPVRNLMSGSIGTLSPDLWDRLASIIPDRYRPTHFGGKMYKLADISQGGRSEYYSRLVSHWNNPEEIVLNADEPYSSGLSDPAPDLDDQEFIAWMQYMDTVTYLPNDILTKLDRASMAVSLEARVPLLDHRVVEHAWRLPMHLKIRNGKGKWILRKILSQYVPEHLFDRPKRGFGVPIGAWLRGPLKDWAENLLDEHLLRQQGFINPEPIRQKWSEHLSGKRNWEYLLWDVLMFQAWLERWG